MAPADFDGCGATVNALDPFIGPALASSLAGAAGCRPGELPESSQAAGEFLGRQFVQQRLARQMPTDILAK